MAYAIFSLDLRIFFELFVGNNMTATSSSKVNNSSSSLWSSFRRRIL